MTPGQISVLKGMHRAGVQVTRASYIAWNWDGLDTRDWTPEHEGELPEHLQDWSLFKREGDRLVYTGPPLD